MYAFKVYAQIETGALNKFLFINNLLFVHSSELHETVMECKWHEKNVHI